MSKITHAIVNTIEQKSGDIQNFKFETKTLHTDKKKINDDHMIKKITF